MNKLKFAIAALVAVVLLVVGGTWAYINIIRDDPPERLAFDDEAAAEDSTSTTSTTSQAEEPDEVSVEGTWEIAPPSVVGYRVGEILFGQTAEGVGRTNDVSGQMVIDGTTVTEATFEVDMTTIESDDNRRDNQFRGRIMDVDTYPTATLVLVDPIELDEIPSDLEVVEVVAMVDLTLRGTTRTVPVDLRARRNGPVIEIDGSLVVVFAEWEIPNPSTVGITTEDHGELEFVLVLSRS